TIFTHEGNFVGVVDGKGNITKEGGTAVNNGDIIY
ncbi:MAG: hypothetical protein ACI9UV_002432, partial [Algoriphagus sp.]